ncbi:MFS transporter [Pseudolabrys sp. Root1462]|jgi:MFS family permease|uniref:MFS transporter n=1 Tax=Pseudolabrys sp. Root1462 TaxID=1736466 RepID=UPI000702967A|nr:MFS transporter [Pseudolabrys sp. Root1462]KQY99417.1 MFS transporter [Pseudolabrys sp. Root1462]
MQKSIETVKPATAYVLVGAGVLILSYCVNAMDRTLFPLLLTDVRREYGLGLPEAGLLSTIFTLGMAVAGLPTGYLLSRYSRKAVIQIGMLIYSAGTIITIMSYGFSDMLVYRALTGVGEAMQLTALLAVFSSYFVRHRAVAVGALNYAYAFGAIIAPMLGTKLLVSYGSWHAPMIAFGVLGFALMILVAVLVRSWLSEATGEAQAHAALGGAATLQNRNTYVLTALSVVFGLGLYGYLGMYPTFLREQLHFAPSDIGRVMSSYGLGVLVSALAGWLGDRFSPRVVLSVSFLAAAVISAALFNGPAAVGTQAALSFCLGMAFSGTIFVNLAAYHVKAVRGELAGRASGVFVTSVYASATVAGYLIGWLVKLFGWSTAGDVQLAALCLLAAVLSLLVRPDLMTRRFVEQAS